MTAIGYCWVIADARSRVRAEMRLPAVTECKAMKARPRSAKAKRKHEGVRGVLCGTDFSPASAQATNVAAALAMRMQAPLDLVHVSAIPAFPPVLEQIREEAARVRRHGALVAGSVVDGNADEVLVERANAAACRLIVLSSLGNRSADRWLLGSVAERTAERATVPTLVVRDAAPIEAWTRGQCALKVFVAFNFTATSEIALDWVRELHALGPCDVVVGYVDWPPEQRARLGGTGSLPLVGNLPDVQAVLERDMHARVGKLLGDVPFRLRVEANWGRPDARLARMAAEEGCDLIVVGSHQYAGFERMWHASVSRGLLRDTKLNVAVVPLATGASRAKGMAPSVRRVLVSTDFSDLANQSIPHAYSLLHGAGTVHLVHVVHPGDVPGAGKRRGAPAAGAEALHARHIEACSEQLRALIPVDAAASGIETEVSVVEHRDVAQAICQTAERLAVDVICLGTHGRSGMSASLLGSVARGVMAISARPLLTVPARAT
jgi:nucleotide-binding universal stress UspA family protein